MEWKQQQLINLVALFDALLNPAVERLSELDKTDNPLLVEHATASLVEAFGWYRIGAASGFVPKHESEILLSKYFHIVRDEKTKRWRDLFYPEFLQWLDSALSSQKLFDSDEWTFENGAAVGPFLQTTAVLAGEFASDGRAQSFSVAVNLFSDAEWEHMLAEGLPVDTLIDCFISDSPVIGLSKESCFVGFFNTLSHFAASKRLAGHLQSSPTISAADRANLRRGIKQVQTWHANTQRANVKQRFNEFADYAGRIILQDIRIRDLGLVEVPPILGDFMKIVDDLIAHWNNFGTPLIGAKA